MRRSLSVQHCRQVARKDWLVHQHTRRRPFTAQTALVNNSHQPGGSAYILEKSRRRPLPSLAWLHVPAAPAGIYSSTGNPQTSKILPLLCPQDWLWGRGEDVSRGEERGGEGKWEKMDIEHSKNVHLTDEETNRPDRCLLRQMKHNQIVQMQ